MALILGESFIAGIVANIFSLLCEFYVALHG